MVTGRMLQGQVRPRYAVLGWRREAVRRVGGLGFRCVEKTAERSWPRVQADRHDAFHPLHELPANAVEVLVVPVVDRSPIGGVLIIGIRQDPARLVD